jgi:glycosyltransferase involved in cell wall biosynthesis
MPPRLSVVIPVYNERATVLELIRRVQAVPIAKEIIVVDDGSTDGTRALLEPLGRDAGVRLFLQDRNRGKGAALRRGFAEARGDFVLVQDADLEYDPQDYPRLLEPLERGAADVVYGSRFLAPGAPGLRAWHTAGNRALTELSNLCTGLRLTDIWTCYKVFRRELLQSLELREDRFGFEPEVTARLARRRARIVEVPVRYRGRTFAEGKKIGPRDVFNGLWATLRYSLFSR